MGSVREMTYLRVQVECQMENNVYMWTFFLFKWPLIKSPRHCTWIRCICVPPFFATFVSHMHALKLLSQFPLRFVAFCSHLYTTFPPQLNLKNNLKGFLMCKWKMCSKTKQVDGNTLTDERMENFANPNGKFAALKTDHIKHQTNRKVWTIP